MSNTVAISDMLQTFAISYCLVDYQSSQLHHRSISAADNAEEAAKHPALLLVTTYSCSTA